MDYISKSLVRLFWVFTTFNFIRECSNQELTLSCTCIASHCLQEFADACNQLCKANECTDERHFPTAQWVAQARWMTVSVGRRSKACHAAKFQQSLSQSLRRRPPHRRTLVTGESKSVCMREKRPRERDNSLKMTGLPKCAEQNFSRT